MKRSTRPALKASPPVMMPGRPRYALYDRKSQEWWEPTLRHFDGCVEDLTLTPDGELMLRTTSNTAIHESAFPERFVVVPHLDNFTSSLN